MNKGVTSSVMEYFSRNWHKKMAKMRKLNSNYLLVATEATGKGWFQSIEDYNNYHKELRELNKKYGLETAMDGEGEASECKISDKKREGQEQ